LSDLNPQFVPASLKYGAEAVAMLGIAYSLIKWVGRTVRSTLSPDAGLEEAKVEALAANTPDVAADSLVRQGLVSPGDLAGMTPRERGFLIATAGQHMETVSRGRGRRPTPASGSSSVGGTSGGGRRPATPHRLHLITPSRPPLGMAVHCPGCGTLLDREALQTFGADTCSRCKRPVTAHIQRGRLTVIVEETPEEAEHRRRIDGDSVSS
jgi:hypothetical protein